MILYQEDINRLIEIQDFIHANLDKDLKVNSLAKKFNLEKHTLCRHFTQHFKIPLHQYIVNIRLAKAHELLANNIKSVSEVAIAVGYRDKSAFSNAFSSKFSMSPKELFKQNPKQ